MDEFNMELAKDLAGLACTIAGLPYEMAVPAVFTILDAIAKANDLTQDDMEKLLSDYLKFRPDVIELSKELTEILDK